MTKASLLNNDLSRPIQSWLWPFRSDFYGAQCAASARANTANYPVSCDGAEVAAEMIRSNLPS